MRRLFIQFYLLLIGCFGLAILLIGLVYQVSASPEQLRAQLALGQLQEVSAPLDAAEPVENPQAAATEAPQVKPRTDQLRFRW